MGTPGLERESRSLKDSRTAREFGRAVFFELGELDDERHGEDERAACRGIGGVA